MKRILLVVLITLLALVGRVGLGHAGDEVSALQSQAETTSEAVSTLQEAVNDRVPFNAKKYYLTENTFDGGDAIMACDLGFHMASMSEIQYPSNNLEYASRSTAAYDSLVDGQRLGLPSNCMGWVRSGSSGTYDCGGWRGKYDAQCGSTLAINDSLYGSEQEEPISHQIARWHAGREICSQRERVWCVENSE